MTPLLLLCLAAAPAEAPPSAAVDYLRDVKPILTQNCVKCHGPDRQRGGLRLDTAAAVRKGGDSGPAAVPGQSGKSRMVLAVTGAEGVKPMPPKGPPLDAARVAVLRAWIDAGAAAPVGEVAAARAGSNHWSFRPVVRPAEPAVKNAAWVRNPIDRFILARLEKEGVAPSPEADRATLIRRLSLDLLGLPPSPNEVDAFVADQSPDAYEKLVDRLLASPHYGERWGRHWLDLARYADSNGYSIDAPRSMWPYRDWVINALNKDMPFDQFAIRQLAGDLLPNATTDDLVATGFHRNTPINEEGGIDLEQFRVDSIVDRVNTTGTVFLGLTVGCCQCHDHKFDPISQREYYQLFAFFNSVDEPKLELPTAGADEKAERSPGPDRRAGRAAQVARRRDAGVVGGVGRKTHDGGQVASAGECADDPGHRRQRPQRSTTTDGARRLPQGRSGAARRRRPGRDQPAGLAGRPPGAVRPHRPGKADRGGQKGASRHPVHAGGARAGDPARDAHPPRRRLPAQGGAGDSGHAVGAAAAAGAGQTEPARPGQVDRRSEKSADGAGDGQPDVAGVFRPRPGGDGERLRHAGDASVAPRIAGLAGVGVRSPRLGREGDAQTHRLLGDLSAGVEGAARPGVARPAQPAAGPAKSVAT